MKRPGWAIAVGILMLLFGGCGALNRAGDLMLPEITELMNESVVEVNNNYDNDDTVSDMDIDDVNDLDGIPDVELLDTLSSKNTKKVEDLSEEDKKILDLLSDTILLDENSNVDFEATMQNTVFISDYRKTWKTRFAYIGMFIAVLFIIGGIMLLGFKKYTIQVVLTTIALSMANNIFQIIIYAADADSGSLIGTISNFGIYVSLAFDILLLILVLVLDKTYYKPVVAIEDYYD